jgi:2,3-bisphosphoglycerate-independent phosphoglycerate mutase
MKKTPVMLLILDGFGLAKEGDVSAIAKANKPFIDALFNNFPHSQLSCHGADVGLPEGVMGNSEVGHLNIGSGRIVYQDIMRIDRSIVTGEFFNNSVLKDLARKTREKGGRLHFMGLLSDGGVHSMNHHLYALLEFARREQLEVFVHPFMDGRDTPPTSGAGYLQELLAQMQKIGVGTVATICGRFWAMDRDTRWDRVEAAYRMLVQGYKCEYSTLSCVEEINKQYSQSVTDEFINPVCFVDEGRIRDNDGVVFFNFRSDRAREISLAFFHPDFSEFSRTLLKLSGYVGMVPYKEAFPIESIFGKENLKNVLGKIVAEAGLRQLRIAETEKYAHVTFFFNGAEEKPFPGEDRILIESPRDVKTYDLKPEMSAFGVTDAVVSKINEGLYDFIVINYANCDMVGHTGIMPAAIKAVETIDKCVEKVVGAMLSRGGRVLLIADHGNAEKMVAESGGAHTAHTLNPVPCIYIGRDSKDYSIENGILADVAPTLVSLLGLKNPAEFTGKNLLKKND